MPIPTLKRWLNGQTFSARDYVYERDLIIAEVNRLANILGSGTGDEDITVNSITIGGHLVDWNEVDGSLDIALNDDVTLQVGQEQVFYGKAYQQDIPNGAPVMFAGVEGNHFRIQVATPEVLNVAPEYFIGIATQEILTGEFGYVSEFGFVRDVNVPTTSYNVGDILWFDSQGTGIGDGWTTTKPLQGYAQIRMAVIVKQNQNQNQANTGLMFVRPTILEKQTGSHIFYDATLPPEGERFNGLTWFDEE